MYIRIAFFIELRLRVSRSLRSLANKYSEISIALPLRVSRSLRSLANKYSEISIALPLRVSRSLRSLANHIDTEKYCESVTVY